MKDPAEATSFLRQGRNHVPGTYFHFDVAFADELLRNIQTNPVLCYPARIEDHFSPWTVRLSVAETRRRRRCNIRIDGHCNCDKLFARLESDVQLSTLLDFRPRPVVHVCPTRRKVGVQERSTLSAGNSPDVKQSTKKRVVSFPVQTAVPVHSILHSRPPGAFVQDVLELLGLAGIDPLGGGRRESQVSQRLPKQVSAGFADDALIQCDPRLVPLHPRLPRVRTAAVSLCLRAAIQEGSKPEDCELLSIFARTHAKVGD
eukprot:1963044-Rhodomonas_salina.2